MPDITISIGDKRATFSPEQARELIADYKKSPILQNCVTREGKIIQNVVGQLEIAIMGGMI
jgi:ribosomal protein S18